MAVATSLFSAVPAELPEELVELLARSDDVRIERIVSRGHASPAGFWYDQQWNEWVVLLSGAARLALRDPDEQLDLKPGDCLLIRAHRRHRVIETAADRDTIWLAVHYR